MSAPTVIDADKLRAALTDVVCLSEEALRRVASISEMALLSLETPEGHLRPWLLVDALRAILEAAHEASNNVSVEASQVGVTDVNSASRKWELAYREALGRQDRAARGQVTA